MARLFGLTRLQLVFASIGWALGVFLTIACIEVDSVVRGYVLPLLIGIPVTLGMMWIGAGVE